MAFLSDLGKGAGWAAAAAWPALRGGPRGRRAGAAATGSMLFAVGLCQVLLKNVIGRRRPFTSPAALRLPVVVGALTHDPAFPSGHTAGSFAAASALAAFYPARARPLALAAAAVGLSRIYLGHHFPSDVVAGAGAGAAVGLLGAALGGAFRARVGKPGHLLSGPEAG